MTSLTANYSNKTSGGAIGKLGAVLRKVFVRFVQVHESPAAMMTSDDAGKREGAAQLNRLAGKYEVSQPNLAAELRFIASRG